MSDSKVPPVNSKQWIKNEKIINNNPALKQARDIKEGIAKPAGHYTNNGGKGSAPRTDINSQQWKDAYDSIDWSATRNEKKSYRVKVNGKYVDETGENNE